MKYTGKFLTQEEIKSVTAALNTPYIIVGGMPPPSPQKLVHSMALAKGLPEIPGYYGADLSTGEIVEAA